MALTRCLRDALRNAVRAYDFPAVCFDFQRDRPLQFGSMREVEDTIRKPLLSKVPQPVKDGLSNILYWGHARAGYRDNRVGAFRSKASSAALERATRLFVRDVPPSIYEIGQLHLPEFSGISFVSKSRMFLDPAKSGVLDRQIMKIGNSGCGTVLDEIGYRQKDTQIRITRRNSKAYESWCRQLIEIGENELEEPYRATDIERGLFQLVQSKQADLAYRILRTARGGTTLV